MKEPTHQKTVAGVTSAGVGTTALLGSVVDAQYHQSPKGWWHVHVLLRRADKNRAWQHRASFMIEEEAHRYALRWKNQAGTKVFSA